MPRGDKTGPEGKGPKTGRGMGDCKKSSNQSTSSIRGTGLGRGQGRRQGRRQGRG